MNILITGGSGFVGANLVRHLLRTQQSARIHLWLRASSNLWRISDIVQKITINHVDMTDVTAMKNSAKSIRPDIIYHLANSGVYGGIAAPPAQLFAVNTLGFLNLLEALDNTAYQALVSVGSSSEYGRKNIPMREDMACEPENFYGISKLAATLAASFHARQSGRPIATFRLFSPYGFFDDKSRLVCRTILSCIRKEPFRLPHSKAVRDWIFIDDINELLVKAASSLDQQKGHVFNVGGGKEVRALDMVHAIADITNAHDFVEALPQEQRDPGLSESPRWEADMTKTCSAFSWRPRVPLEAGLKETVRWYTDHLALYPLEQMK